MKSKKFNIDTSVIHSGDSENQTDAIVPPIYHSVNYRGKSLDKIVKAALRKRPLNFYGRYNNPLVQQAGKICSDLEKTDDALILESGMAAISTALTCILKSSDHIIAQKNLYAGTTKYLRDILPRFGIKTTFVDQKNTDSFKKAIRYNTKIIYVETPSNPMMNITDLHYIGKLGKRHSIMTMADNTFLTPVNQNPVNFGIDVVLHSGTKFLGGHSDLLAGVICSKKNFIEKCWEYAHIAGHVLSPFEASLLLRGLKTLTLRVRKQNESALKLANYLTLHPKVKKVYYPGLENFPQHELAKNQLKKSAAGFGSMLSFELKADYRKTKLFIESLKLWTLSVSLGGVESLAMHPASMWIAYYTKEQFRRIGISESMVRLSVGIESADDLINDIEICLKRI